MKNENKLLLWQLEKEFWKNDKGIKPDCSSWEVNCSWNGDNECLLFLTYLMMMGSGDRVIAL